MLDAYDMLKGELVGLYCRVPWPPIRLRMHPFTAARVIAAQVARLPLYGRSGEIEHVPGAAWAMEQEMARGDPSLPRIRHLLTMMDMHLHPSLYTNYSRQGPAAVVLDETLLPGQVVVTVQDSWRDTRDFPLTLHAPEAEADG